jgi:hypothetical protein
MAKAIGFYVPSIFRKTLKRGFVEAMWKGYRVLHADKEISLGTYPQSGSDMPR